MKCTRFYLLVLVVSAIVCAQQPCETKAYLDLKKKSLDSLTSDELSLLLDFQENCFDAQRKQNFPVSPCDDETFMKLSKIPYDKLSQNQLRYLSRLEEDCNDCNSARQRDIKWRRSKPAVIFGIAAAFVGGIVLFVVVPIVMTQQWLKS
jgi:hypothetical protein